MIKDRTIGFIGAGNMAEALIRGLLNSGRATPQRLAAFDVRSERLEYLNRELGIGKVPANLELVASADVLVLAVKPQNVEAVLEEICNCAWSGKTVVSIIAGTSTAYIESKLGKGVRVVRAMPNTPMLVGQGMTGLAKGRWATDEDLGLAREMFASAGKVIVVDENLINAVTAVSGSGPAYFFYVADALEEAARELGFAAEDARTLAVQTAFGSATLLAQSAETAAELRKKVTSPGGTTQAAIEVLDREGARETFIEAVKRAEARAREIGR